MGLSSFLLNTFGALGSLCKDEAYPANWLNITIIAHKAALKALRVSSRLMKRFFAPVFPVAANMAEGIDQPLWSAFIEVFLTTPLVKVPPAGRLFRAKEARCTQTRL